MIINGFIFIDFISHKGQNQVKKVAIIIVIVRKLSRIEWEL